MKKLIHTALIALAIASATGNASASTEITAQPKLSYACTVMLERGSAMFCGEAATADTYAKAAISELAYANSSSFACNTMAARGSEMFCGKEKAASLSRTANN